MDKMIFIVDDNDANLTVAASALEDEYKVLTMPSAKKMFTLLEKKQPNLILLDIEMPEMTGFEAIVKLKENPQWKEIPVIFLTGLENESLKNESIKAGALEVVSKPIVKSTLLERVKNYI